MADRKKYTTVGGVPAPEGSDLRRMIDANLQANEEARADLGRDVIATATAARDASAAADEGATWRSFPDLPATFRKATKRRLAKAEPVNVFATPYDATYPGGHGKGLTLVVKHSDGSTARMDLPVDTVRQLLAFIARVGIVLAFALMLSASTARADGVDEARGKAARAAERRADSCMLHTDSLVCGMKAFCQEHPSALRCNVRSALPASTFRVLR